WWLILLVICPKGNHRDDCITYYVYILIRLCSLKWTTHYWLMNM
ncbi:Os08g0430050, partial [Oryza sativa Japonica Group]